MSALQTTEMTWRVDVLQPIGHGRAHLVHSWHTDGHGVLEALASAPPSGLAVQVELEGWLEAVVSGESRPN
jgi:hypothetical protein